MDKSFQQTKIGQIPVDWKIKKIKQLGDGNRPAVKAGPFGSSLKKEYYVASGYKIYGQEQVIAGDAHYGNYYIDEKRFESLKSCEVLTDDILISLVGTVGKVLVVPPDAEKGIINPRLLRLAFSKEKVFTNFAKYWLSSEIVVRLLQRYAQGGTMGVLNAGILQSIPFPLPPLAEQKAIAQILGTWDEAIAVTEALIEALSLRKRALMQRLLLPNRETGNPAQRLHGYSEDWQERRFKKVFDRVTRKNTVGNDNPLTISAQYGLVNQKDFFNKYVASEKLDGYYLLKNGEFAYNKSYSAGYPFGAIKRLDDYEAGVLSTLYICFRLIDELHDSDYFTHFFEAGGMNHGIYTIAQEGARNHGLLNMSIHDFFNLEIHIPSPQEQSELADLFNTQDEIISGMEQLRDNLQEQKRGLMQMLLTGQVRVEV